MSVCVYGKIKSRWGSQQKTYLIKTASLNSSEKEQMAFEKLRNRRVAERERRKIRSDQIKLLLLERGLSVFNKFGISKVIVFGSVADGVCGEMSDIDILVAPLKNSQYWDFRFELEEAVNLPIDLYTDLDDPIMVEKIISRGETLYEV